MKKCQWLLQLIKTLLNERQFKNLQVGIWQVRLSCDLYNDFHKLIRKDDSMAKTTKKKSVKKTKKTKTSKK